MMVTTLDSKFFQAALEATTSQKLQNAMENSLASYGITNYMYRAGIYEDLTAPYISSFDKNWMTVYREKNYDKKNFISEHLKTHPEFFWDSRLNQDEMLKDAEPFKLHKGFAIYSQTTKARFVVVDSFPTINLSEKFIENIPLIKPIAELFHQKMQCFLNKSSRKSVLTHKEFNVLQWIAYGKTNRETAEILGNSVSTVNFHLKNIFDKLGVYNKPAAIYQAFKLKIL